MTAKYPIFGQDRDKWIYMILSEQRLNSDLEVIDIENREYVGWDSEGKPLEFYLDNNTIKIRCTSNESKLNELNEAILNYVKVAAPNKPFSYLKHFNSVGDFFRAVENHINSG